MAYFDVPINPFTLFVSLCRSLFKNRLPHPVLFACHMRYGLLQITTECSVMDQWEVQKLTNYVLNQSRGFRENNFSSTLQGVYVACNLFTNDKRDLEIETNSSEENFHFFY
ncbi:hypothetical protein CDAR_509521 [Caerostris darwini]|uniref:Uncharacterized protein n=1 Tax=Caerostris darwini TaxID=1538125 RepID=A0AAV4PZL8_9ARAC|nr:hypothetical protein CDAR_509521 [Caerostris darwini]